MGFFEALGSFVSGAADAVGDVIETVGDAVADGVEAVGNALGLSEAGAAVADAIRLGSEFIAQAIRDLGNWLGGVFEAFDGLVAYRIVDSGDDLRAPSVRKLEATSMSVAGVTSPFAYRDSGRRLFFQIVGGVVRFRSPGGDLRPVEPTNGGGPRTVSYHDRRAGRRRRAPRFDMVAANSGRVFVKRYGRTRFYFTMLEPMFRRGGGEPVLSAYFKLDPEQGRATADVADLLAHLPAAAIDHPAAVRFPLFGTAMQLPGNSSMIVNVDLNLRVWHRLDGRPPRDAPDPPSSATRAVLPPTDCVVTYRENRPWLLGRAGEECRTGYTIRRVLDIGVGHEHWHEQAPPIPRHATAILELGDYLHHQVSALYGGDMDSLNGPGLHRDGEIVLNGRDVYRMFNGPVDDMGGFIDNTICYYVMCQFLKDGTFDPDYPPANAYGILWIDEQSVLSERWRLVHPDDHEFGSFRDVIPSSIIQYLHKDFSFETLRFDRKKFFCPFRAGLVRHTSRMAVSRQVIAVTGLSPGADGPRIYSINFSFGTCDRTWRWRPFPPFDAPWPTGTPPFPTTIGSPRAARAAATAGPVTVPIDTGGTTPPLVPAVDPLSSLDAFGLREDMTLYMRQTAPQGRRYWFQRYLPADHRMSPDGASLELPASVPWPLEADDEEVDNGLIPGIGYGHDWQWLPADVFEEVHARYSHFGVYENVVDWRGQYYRVDVLKGEETIRRMPVETAWIDVDGTSFIDRPFLRWDVVNAVLQGQVPADLPPNVAADVVLLLGEAVAGTLTLARAREVLQRVQGTSLTRTRQRRGLFNGAFAFKLLYRQPLGWLLAHWDKRDDDLMPLSNLGDIADPQSFRLRLAPASNPDATPGDTRIELDVRSWHSVPSPPVVEKARIRLVRNQSGAVTSAVIRFSSPLSDEPLAENVWGVRIGGLSRQGGALGAADTFFSRLRLGVFERESAGGPWHRFEWPLDTEPAAVRDRVTAACTPLGRLAFGTSIWFEDVVGRVAVPDLVEFEEV